MSTPSLRPVIDNRSARNVFLACHALSENPREKQSRGDLLSLIERIGFVQVDSINTVARAHDMILFARNQTYRPDYLKALLEQDRGLFENWTHDAAIIPAQFFPYWRPRFTRSADQIKTRWTAWRRPGFLEMLDSVLDQIDRNGPTMSRDLTSDVPNTGDGWWDWHPAKTALEFLWRTGEIAVSRREGFQKVYDLSDRVIPEPYRSADVSSPETVDWACRSALDRLGFATSGELAAFWAAVSPKEAAHWCAARIGSDLVEVTVEPADGGKPRKCFARADFRAQIAEASDPPKRLRVLSPFDPVVRDRARTERLFGYRYRIEVFVPAAKRAFGYYVFPLLEGDKLIGRIDMKHERQVGTLRVKGLWFEPSVRRSAARDRALQSELERMRKFTGADRIAFDNGYDEALR